MHAIAFLNVRTQFTSSPNKFVNIEIIKKMYLLSCYYIIYIKNIFMYICRDWCGPGKHVTFFCVFVNDILSVNVKMVHKIKWYFKFEKIKKLIAVCLNGNLYILINVKF